MKLVDMKQQYLEMQSLGEYDLNVVDAVVEIRASLQARLEGRNEGGDTEVMRLVNELEIKARVAGYDEAIKQHLDSGGTMNF